MEADRETKGRQRDRERADGWTEREDRQMDRQRDREWDKNNLTNTKVASLSFLNVSRASAA